MKRIWSIAMATILAHAGIPDHSRGVKTHTSSILAPAAWEVPEVSLDLQKKVFYQAISDPILMPIPIVESHEPLVDLKEIQNPRIRAMAELDPAFKNTYQGFSKVRRGVYLILLRMLDTLPPNIGIAYYEGFRSLAKQKEYFDNKFRENLKTIDDVDRAYLATTRDVSPFIDNIPTHATGAAIDMTLFEIDEMGHPKLMDMGMFDVIYGPNDQQETFSANTTLTQRKNRLLLLKGALTSGLANYGHEWWHFSYGDKIHSQVYGQPKAIYGLATDQDQMLLHMSKKAYYDQILSSHMSKK